MKQQFIKLLDYLYPVLSQDQLNLLSLSFKHELIAAFSNQISSLPSILNPIYKMQPNTGQGIAVSVGGTNGYVSFFNIQKNGTVQFPNRAFFPLPENTTKEKLFTLITSQILKIHSLKEKPLPIGIGLAYPLHPLIHHHFIDGELLYMTKGRKIDGLVGKKVGQEYHKFLISEYGIDTVVSVANDAICLLLGGDSAEVAGVVGTGLNFAFWEKRENIVPLKLSELPRFVQKEVAVNIESKNFNKIPETSLRKIIDLNSNNQGFSLAEKETAGAYLYQIFNAGKEKLIGKNFLDLSSTDQLNDILTKAFSYPVGTDDLIKEKTVIFAERIFQRSAQIVAIELCGILMKIKKTKGITPVVMEGGLFWKAKNYSTLVNLYINKILPEVLPSYTRLYGSSRRGIAILASNTI
jgi:hexokinase